MREDHEPDARFVEKLEWQLTSEFRRSDRLKPHGTVAVPRGVVVMAIVAGVLLTGVAATKAADLIKDSWRKKIELAKAETDIRLQEALLAFKADHAAKTEEQFALGLVGQEEQALAKLAQERCALDLEELRSDLSEVRASGEAPRNEIYAPTVGGHDFVAERLAIQKRRLELNLEVRHNRLEQRLRSLIELGLAPRDQLDDFVAETATQEALIKKAQQRIDLRNEFVAGRLSAKDVEIRDRIALAERDLSEAQSRVDSLRRQVERAQSLEAAGLASDPSVKGLRLGLNSAQEELALANLTIEILKSIK